jgi:hypothetical protein
LAGIVKARPWRCFSRLPSRSSEHHLPHHW